MNEEVTIPQEATEAYNSLMESTNEDDVREYNEVGYADLSTSILSLIVLEWASLPLLTLLV